jgi:hypothetical protein
VVGAVLSVTALGVLTQPALATNGSHGEKAEHGEHEVTTEDHGRSSPHDDEVKGDQAGRHGAAKGDPAGNNGTVKIDAEPFDTHPGNEPHVGCRFQVDFYGFDEGDLFADVIFTAHPPTGKGETLLEDRVFIGEDDHSGGGSEAGIDAEREYDLSAALASFTPHPKQGYHVKLTVHADGSQGADTKHKVFWVEGCNQPPPTTSTSVGGTQTSGSKTESAAPTVSGTETGVLSSGAEMVAVPAAGDVASAGETAVLGAVLSRPAATGAVSPASAASPAAVSPAAASRSGVLAFTGSDVVSLALIGAGLLLAGAVAFTARRRHQLTA